MTDDTPRYRATKDGVLLIPGREYVIQREARLYGMVPKPGYMSGWSQDLHPGDIVRYEDAGAGWGSDPLPVEHHWSTPESREVRSQFTCLKPDEGFWDSRPAAGLVALREETP
jgi:hypothetical protein